MVVYSYTARSLYLILTSFVFHVIVAVEERKCPETCPVVSPDMCVRVTKHSDGKAVYTLMSMCEFERVSCRQDVKAMVVPLKFCFDSANANQEGKMSSKIQKPTRTHMGNQGRRKRSISALRQLEPDPCSRKCPTRNQMVCARCEHGVFRTFMSICHLREHQCRKRKDRIELVARRPCESTGLYFEPPRPAVAVTEPEDADPVLEHIYSVIDSRPHVTINLDRERDSKTHHNRRAKIHRTKARTRDARTTH